MITYDYMLMHITLVVYSHEQYLKSLAFSHIPKLEPFKCLNHENNDKPEGRLYCTVLQYTERALSEVLYCLKLRCTQKQGVCKKFS